MSGVAAVHYMGQTAGRLEEGRTLRLDWDRIIATWALVLVLILGGTAAVQLMHRIDRAEANPAVHGAKIPQRDPFNLGPPAFENNDPAAAQVDD
jgi:NO-binding membrane sensor protein with MHYT domain